MKFGNLRLFATECIGFSTPRAIVFNLFSIIASVTVIPTKWIIYSPFKCVFKNLIFPIIFKGNCPAHWPFYECGCPACGLTRALSHLLHADILGAAKYNFLIFPLMIVILYVFIDNLRKVHVRDFTSIIK